MEKNTNNRKISIVLEYTVGKVRELIYRLIQVYQPSILVVGTKGKSSSSKKFKGLLPGSVSKWCLQNSPIPVIVVKPVLLRQKIRDRRDKQAVEDKHSSAYRAYMDMFYTEKTDEIKTYTDAASNPNFLPQVPEFLIRGQLSNSYIKLGFKNQTHENVIQNIVNGNDNIISRYANYSPSASSISISPSVISAIPPSRLASVSSLEATSNTRPPNSPNISSPLSRTASPSPVISPIIEPESKTGSIPTITLNEQENSNSSSSKKSKPSFTLNNMPSSNHHKSNSATSSIRASVGWLSPKLSPRSSPRMSPSLGPSSLSSKMDYFHYKPASKKKEKD